MHLLPQVPRQRLPGESLYPTRERYFRRRLIPPLFAQLLKQIAKLTLLEHGQVVGALGIDRLPQPAALKGGRGGAAAKKAAAAAQNIEDADQGESTDETIDEFKERLRMYVESLIDQGKKAGGGAPNQGRDEYKESGTVFDVRKRVIAEFLKSLSGKKRCEHCGA